MAGIARLCALKVKLTALAEGDEGSQNSVTDESLSNVVYEPHPKTELGKGIDRYLNGILRNLTRTRPWLRRESLQDAPQWTKVSLPKWLWNRWEKRFGKPLAESFAVSLNVPPRRALHIVEKPELPVRFPFEVTESDIVPDAYIRSESESKAVFNDRNALLFQYQDEASQLVPHLVGDDVAGWRIWDACAAPGGKSVILGKICGDSGRLIASDLRSDRILRMVEAIRKSGLSKVDVVIADASKSAPFRQCFDAVLADVPCSGLGTLRRNPEIKWRFRIERFDALQNIQKQIIHNVSEVVRVGGRLLYSTCSTEPEENEQVIESFLSAHPGFRLEEPTNPPGIRNYICPDKMIRTFPGVRLWDGFFAALLVRHK
jgi:16S rRNA (cytosine967-C5)-methyltransferase